MNGYNHCARCGNLFEIEIGEHWKTLCYPCWKISKSSINNRPTPSQVMLEQQLRLRIGVLENENKHLRERLRAQENEVKLDTEDLRRLRMLCHPDRHQGSTMANTMSQKLNELLRNT